MVLSYDEEATRLLSGENAIKKPHGNALLESLDIPLLMGPRGRRFDQLTRRQGIVRLVRTLLTRPDLNAPTEWPDILLRIDPELDSFVI